MKSLVDLTNVFFSVETIDKLALRGCMHEAIHIILKVTAVVMMLIFDYLEWWFFSCGLKTQTMLAMSGAFLCLGFLIGWRAYERSYENRVVVR